MIQAPYTSSAIRWKTISAKSHNPIKKGEEEQLMFYEDYTGLGARYQESS